MMLEEPRARPRLMVSSRTRGLLWVAVALLGSGAASAGGEHDPELEDPEFVYEEFFAGAEAFACVDLDIDPPNCTPLQRDEQLVTLPGARARASLEVGLGSATAEASAEARRKSVAARTSRTPPTGTEEARSFGNAYWLGGFRAASEFIMIEYSIRTYPSVSHLPFIELRDRTPRPVYQVLEPADGTFFTPALLPGEYTTLAIQATAGGLSDPGAVGSRATEVTLGQILQCPAEQRAAGPEVCLRELPYNNQYRVEEWLECHPARWGYRYKLVPRNAPRSPRDPRRPKRCTPPDYPAYWIAACLYPRAENRIRYPGDAFAYDNAGLNEKVVDIYTYDPQTNTLTRGRVTLDEYDREFEAARQEGRNPVFPAQREWSPPPTDPEAFGAGPVGRSKGTTGEETGMSTTAAGMLSLGDRTGDRWSYELLAHGSLPVFVAPGDRISLRGGFSGGAVEDQAVEPAFGGWVVHTDEAERLVFEATTYAVLRGAVTGFIGYGQGEATEDGAYELKGDWLSGSGVLPAPDPAISSWISAMEEVGKSKP